MLSVLTIPIMLSVIMLSYIMLGVFRLNAVMLSVVAPSKVSDIFIGLDVPLSSSRTSQWKLAGKDWENTSRGHQRKLRKMHRHKIEFLSHPSLQETRH